MPKNSIQKWLNLLENIELDIFNLIDKKYNNEITIIEIEEDIDKIEESLLIKTNLNRELIIQFIEIYKLTNRDLDLINLVIKFMSTASKIVFNLNSIYFGVKEIDYHPSQDISMLSNDYFINKYTKHPRHYKYLENQEMLKFANLILLPFTIKYCLETYSDL